MVYRAVCFAFVTAVAGLLPGVTLADTVRAYDFTGLLTAGSVDTGGAFGPVGGDLSGLAFSADVSIDLTQSMVSPDPYDGRIRTAQSTLSQTLTVNGVTENLASSNFTFDYVPNGYAQLNTSALSFYVTTDDGVGFLDMDSKPGSYILNCHQIYCGDETLFPATLSVASFKTNVQQLAVTDTPVPLPASAWLLLSGLAGLGAISRKRRES
jgi:hypothetical protein